MYNFTDSMFLPTAVKNIINPAQLSDYLFRCLPDFDKQFDKENTNIICEYNYIDANYTEITCDHTDVIDLKNNVKEDYWYLIRPLRCTMPFTVFNNKPTYDAGAVANIPVNSVFSRYKPANVFFVHATPQLIYDAYPTQTYVDLVTNSLQNVMYAANNSMQSSIELNTNDCNTVVYCSMSNDLDQSEDKFHKGLFSDWEKQCPYSLRFYNGLFYNMNPLMRVIENEGYIQMYYQLKKAYPRRKLVFKIPNPEVYNSNVKEIVREALSRNLGLEFLKEFIKAPVI